MRIRQLIVAVLVVSASSSATSGAQQPKQQGNANAQVLRVAIVPFSNQTGDAALNGLARQIEDVAVSKAGDVGGAELVRGSASGVSVNDAVSAIASRTRASIVVRGTISTVGDQIQLDASAVDAASGKVIHHLPIERAPASNLSAAVERLANRVAGMLALHVSRSFTTNPQLYSVPTLEAFRLYMRGDSLFYRGRPAEALSLNYRAYEVDSMYVFALFLPVAIHNNAGRAAVADSVLAVIRARQDRLTDLERLSFPWFSEPPAKGYTAAKTGLQMDPSSDVWTYAVGYSADGAGYYRDAVDILSRRAELAARGSYSAQTWSGWRAQYLTALHATGDYTRALNEVKQARAELAGANENTYALQELQALAALGRIDELHAIVTRLMSRRADSVPLNMLGTAGMELKRHGHKQDGDRLLSDLATFVAAHESSFDSLTYASYLALGRRYDEALPRLAKLAEGSNDYTRVGRYGVFATLAGKRDVGDQAMARLAQIGDVGISHIWRGYIAAASGDCQGAVAHFRTAVDKGYAFAANGFWHWDPSTEPIWGCDAFEKLPPMRAP